MGRSTADGYRKLLDFLDLSHQYRADRLLARLPSDSMYEVRAVLLGRLGQHEAALQIYVNRLNNHRIAEECVTPWCFFHPRKARRRPEW
jgi:hypothetical protein